MAPVTAEGLIGITRPMFAQVGTAQRGNGETGAEESKEDDTTDHVELGAG